MTNRRQFLRFLGGASLALPFAQHLVAPGRAMANPGQAKRIIIFYFPDGVPGQSQDGDASKWHARGSEFDFSLPDALEPLARHKDDCVFLNGLSMGATDSGSHPGGAKKLLTGVDGGGGESIDQYLARTVGGGSPHRHVYLGAMANHNNASGDKHISYLSAGNSISPEDNPLRAFERLFGSSAPTGNPSDDRRKALKVSVIDGALAEMQALQSRLGGTEAAKLRLHLEALREVEQRVKNDAMQNNDPELESTCSNPVLNTSGVDASLLYEPDRFPSVLRLQVDILVQAMACGLTRVGTLQASHHTSELIMSRFQNSEMYDAGFDMRSHQASHYGARHDPNHREFRDFVRQRRWFVSQFAYLLDQLADRDEPGADGTMLDHTLVWMCTEVSDGNTHQHDNMPFVLAGRAGGCLSTGRFIDYGYARHSNLLVSLAHAMGDTGLSNFGQASSGPLSRLLG